MKTCKLPVTGLRVCSMCNLNVVEDDYHFILQCEKYIDARTYIYTSLIDVRRRYLKKYYWQMPSCFELIQLLSTQY
jgi:hypothetical protein